MSVNVCHYFGRLGLALIHHHYTAGDFNERPAAVTFGTPTVDTPAFEFVRATFRAGQVISGLGDVLS